MGAVILAILAAICWGVAPVAAKIALHQVSPIIGMGVRSMIATSLVTVWLVVSGHYRMVPLIKFHSMVWLIIEAVLATVVGDALYFYALQQGKAGQIGMIMASSPIITLITADILLGETSTPNKILGAALVIGGLIIVSK